MQPNIEKSSHAIKNQNQIKNDLSVKSSNQKNK